MNQQPGKLTGYDCPVCMNRGYVYVVRGDDMTQRQCSCLEVRRSMRRIRESGLADSFEACSFASFTTEYPWQKTMKTTAQKFISDCGNGKWFYVGGQVGSGKTHICTAIVGKLLNEGKSGRYMRWRDDSVRLKACINDDAEYNRLIAPLKSVDVLYIDDLFKVANGNPPKDADVNLAFEILNHRYINKRLATILSGERTMDELIAIDEAVGSRIYERTKGYCLIVPKNSEYNYRMR